VEVGIIVVTVVVVAAAITKDNVSRETFIKKRWLIPSFL